MSQGILAGLRVVEVSAFVAAPLGGMTLAQMGAEVIRIDPPGGGLDFKRWPVTDDGVSLFWNGLNKSKRSVVIDFTTERGRELAIELITAPGADGGILLTNFPPRGWLDFDALSNKRKDLIQLTVMGDHKGGSAVDYTVNPRMGLPMLTGSTPDTEVTNHVLPAWDLITGQMAALGILAAERHRRRNGDGQHIKLALEDVALAVMAHLGFVAEAQLGVERQPCGNDLFGAFGRDFATADKHRVMVVGLTGKQWKALCRATDTEASISELGDRLGVDLQQEGERFKARNEIANLIGPWIQARDLSEVANVFDSHGVCWGRYQSVRELVTSDPSCSEQNPMFSRVDQPGVGSVLSPALPLQFASGRVVAQPAPILGRDTDSVLSSLLGTSGAQLTELRSAGVIG